MTRVDVANDVHDAQRKLFDPGFAIVGQAISLHTRFDFFDADVTRRLGGRFIGILSAGGYAEDGKQGQQRDDRAMRRTETSGLGGGFKSRYVLPQHVCPFKE